MEQYIIRRATEQDAIGLTDCIVDAYAKYSDLIDDLPDVSTGVADDIRNNLVWVAEQSGRITGGLILVVDQKAVKLANIAVHPRATGMGLGRKLLDQAIAECRALNITEIILTTHIKMPDNIAIYQKLGWQEAGRQGNKVFMSRKL